MKCCEVPATLLHGSGAIGGVVNVIDERIPTKFSDEISGEVVGAFSTVDDAKRCCIFLSAVLAETGHFMLTVLRKDANETNIPVLAAHEEHDEHEEEHEEDHDEHDEHDEHEEEGHDEHEESNA